MNEGLHTEVKKVVIRAREYSNNPGWFETEKAERVRQGRPYDFPVATD